MAITIEKAGARLYFGGSTFAAKDRLKGLGAHWDGERRAWWIGAKKETEATALVEALNGGATLASAAAAESVGLRSDTPAAVVADKLEESGNAAAAEALRAKPKQDPDDIRLTGKGWYKGREYYAGSMTRDGTKVRLLTLPDAQGNYLDFWAFCSEVEQTKTYAPREVWDGRRYSGRTRTVYTTLGGIAKFVAEQREAKAAGEPACAECGKRGGELVADLEDGMFKHRGCCDIPPS